MTNIRSITTLCIAFFAFAFSTLPAQEYAYQAEFNTPQNAEGWKEGPTTPSSIDALVQKTSLNGSDGVLSAQSPLSWVDAQIIFTTSIELDLEKYGAWDSIEVRLRQLDATGQATQPWESFGTLGLFAPGNKNLKLIGNESEFWDITPQDDHWVIAKADISFMASNAITRVRLDPIGGPDSQGKNFEVDYIRMTASGIDTTPPPPTFLDSLEAPKDPKNIVFILIDDMGWADLGCYGSDLYETPHIDAFAKTGVLFTDAYSASPLCSPTRASILTGLEPGRLRFTTPSGHVEQVVLDPKETQTANTHNKATIPGTCTRLSNDYITLAESFKAMDYQTAFLGKWHLGREPYIPENQGFDYVIGGREHPGPPGPGGFFAPWNCVNMPVVPDGTHICDMLTDEAMKYLTTHKEDPFMMCLWYYDVHAPFQAKEDLITKYENKLTGDHIQRSAIMASMVDNLDQNIGRLMAKIESLQLDENTIVVLTSDNGGNMYDCPEGQVATNNFPLRAGKGNNYEGGVRVPLIVRAPGVTTANTNSNVVTSTVDHYITLFDLLDVPFPKSLVTDGVSFLPALKGEEYDRSPIYSTFCHRTPRTGNLPNISMRDKEWRLYRFYHDGPQQEHRYELYNLKEDIGETNNVAKDYPAKVQAMIAAMDAHIEEADILESQLNKNYIGNAADGWWGSDDVDLSIVDNKLHLEVKAGDPYIETDFIPSFGGSSFYFRFKMKSSATGGGKIYWKNTTTENYTGIKSVSFDPIHDDQWHEYRVAIPVSGNISRFNITPATTEGTVEIKDLQMETVDGYKLRDWSLRHSKLTTTGLSTQNTTESISIEPNPAKSEFNISHTDLCHVKVYSLDGKQVYASPNAKRSHRVEVSDWQSNVYLVNVVTKEAVYSQRLLVQ